MRLGSPVNPPQQLFAPERGTCLSEEVADTPHVSRAPARHLPTPGWGWAAVSRELLGWSVHPLRLPWVRSPCAGRLGSQAPGGSLSMAPVISTFRKSKARQRGHAACNAVGAACWPPWMGPRHSERVARVGGRGARLLPPSSGRTAAAARLAVPWLTAPAGAGRWLHRAAR